jgi:hypothetical protein
MLYTEEKWRLEADLMLWKFRLLVWLFSLLEKKWRY